MLLLIKETNVRACVQRVSQASVTVATSLAGEIGRGLVVLLGVAQSDGVDEVAYMVRKITQLRIFEDDQGKMNRNLLDVKGEMLVVSQFTLLGDCRKGRRPSFVEAAEPVRAKELYECFVAGVRALRIPVATGVFQAEMAVALVNEGPVTMLLDSRKTA